MGNNQTSIQISPWCAVHHLQLGKQISKQVSYIAIDQPNGRWQYVSVKSYSQLDIYLLSYQCALLVDFNKSRKKYDAEYKNMTVWDSDREIHA